MGAGAGPSVRARCVYRLYSCATRMGFVGLEASSAALPMAAGAATCCAPICSGLGSELGVPSVRPSAVRSMYTPYPALPEVNMLSCVVLPTNSHPIRESVHAKTNLVRGSLTVVRGSSYAGSTAHQLKCAPGRLQTVSPNEKIFRLHFVNNL